MATKEGRGKSAGGRTILAFKNEDKIIWLHYFPKNDKANITASELHRLKTLSNILFALKDNEIEKLLKLGELVEVDENV